MDNAELVYLFSWSEAEFRERHAGSSILRIGYQQWLRNIAVALGNAASSKNGNRDSSENYKDDSKEKIIFLLKKRISESSNLVGVHASWALRQYDSKV